MTKSIDEWAAEKCSVVLGYVPNYNGHGTKTWAYKRVQYYWAWTIKDPRCREIMLDWVADNPEHYRLLFGYINNWLAGKMKKAEAEIAAITAIYESERLAEES